MPSTSAYPAPVRIMVRGVNWLGDAVMTTPALQRLRERFPEAHIALVTPAKLKDLWTGHPSLSQVIDLPADRSVLAVARRLRAERFDLALLFPNSPRAALEAFLAGVPRRVGGRWPWRNWMLTKAVASAPESQRMRKRTVEEIRQLISRGKASPSSPTARGSAVHQMHHYLRVVGAVGADATPTAPRLTVSLREIEAVRVKYGFRPGSSWLGINPGAEYGPAKRWPVERFAAVADAIRREFDCGIAVFGGLGDVALAEELAEQLQTAAPTLRILAGKTTLRELLASLMCCRVLLTNDTGPMHAAAAVGVPVVAPFGSTSPEMTGPGLPGDPHHQIIQTGAACSPCFLRTCPIDFRCMLGIEAERVMQAVRTAWGHGLSTDFASASTKVPV